MNPVELPPLTWWDKYGLLGIAVVCFAGVIAYLFKLLMTNHAARVAALEAQLVSDASRVTAAEHALTTERAQHEVAEAKWELERQKLRADYEQRERERSDRYARDLHELRREFQSREDEARNENAAAAERMGAAHVKAMERVTDVVQKIYDRFIGPRARRGG